MQLGQALKVAAVPVGFKLPVALHARLALRGAADARAPHAAPLLCKNPAMTAQNFHRSGDPVRQHLTEKRLR